MFIKNKVFKGTLLRALSIAERIEIVHIRLVAPLHRGYLKFRSMQDCTKKIENINVVQIVS